MRTIAKVTAAIVMACAFMACGASQDANSSISAPKNGPNDRFTCTYKDLFSDRIFTEGGATEEAASRAGASECTAKTGSQACVRLRCNDTNNDLAEDQAGATTCQVQDLWTGRVWYRPGATPAEARRNALTYCTNAKAGINCQILQCFDQSLVHDQNRP